MATTPQNRLIASLSPAEFGRLTAKIERIVLSSGDIISAGGSTITHAYFPEDGIISMVQRLADGSAVEVGVVGSEGFVGIPLMLGSKSSPAEANVQIKGSAWK